MRRNENVHGRNSNAENTNRVKNQELWRATFLRKKVTSERNVIHTIIMKN